jgi:hypothetical protein
MFELLSWIKNRKEINEYILEQDKTINNLKSELQELNGASRILDLFPDTRGHRYDDILVPNWVQYDDMNKLGIDLANYLTQEVYPTKIHKK